MESVMAEASEMAIIREERREKGWRKWESFPSLAKKNGVAGVLKCTKEIEKGRW